MIRHPRFWLWLFRLLPLTVGTFWLVGVSRYGAFTSHAAPSSLLILFPPSGLFDDFGTVMLQFVLLAALVPYAVLTVMIFPVLLFQIPPFDHSRRWLYPVIALVTFGLGTFLLHLLYVDPVFCWLADRTRNAPAT